MLSCFDIANYFLAKAKLNDDTISNLKLQKLVYYSQGFHLAIFEKPLFSEKIYAWAHGPVIKELYAKYSSFGSDCIESSEEIDLKKYKEFNAELLDLLDQIFDIYGQFSAWKLRNMTHEEPPWKNTPPNNEITHAKMTDYFTTQFEHDE